MVNQAAGSKDKADRTSSLPEHLIELPGGQWAVWRCVGLRGAGFPAEQVLDLADSECAAMTDQLVQAEDELMTAQNTAQDALDQELRETSGEAEGREAIKKALRRVKKCKLPKPLDFEYASKTAVETFCQAHLAAAAARTDFEKAFTTAIDRTSQAIYKVACTNRFQEAIIWQNRQALLTGVRPILRKPPGTTSRGSQRRQHEELVANYLQRYCVKNDTIGFFGPVGWARFVSQGDTLIALPGPDLLESRQVYFEGWGIDALSETLGQNKAIRPWTAPQRIPSIYLEGTKLYLPFKTPFEISAREAAVLQACNGKQTAKEIALQIIQNPTLEAQSEAEVYELLEQLNSMGLIVWALQVPLETHPEQTLRRLLERIEDERLRQLNLRALGVFEKARDGVAQAVGDAAKLEQALNVMDMAFKRLTSASPTRAAGETYAARTLVYEDCRRDIEVEIGPEILKALGPPLSLLLDSARWFAVEAAAISRQTMHQVYTELAAQTCSPTVPLANFWQRLQSILSIEEGFNFDHLLSVFQERWLHVLSIPNGARRVEYHSEELRPRVLAAFESPQPGWPFTRCQSPDVFIVAASTKDVQRGDYQLVMGELHMGNNTLGAAFFLAQHPHPEEILQALVAEQPEPQVVCIPPKQWNELTARTRYAFARPQDFCLISSYDAYGSPELRTLDLGAMVIEDAGHGLVIRTRDGQFRFELVQFTADLIASQLADYFKLLPPAPHTPRVTIDRLVISRETWRFPVGELTFAHEKEEANRFLAARRWMQQHDLPRFVFAKTPIERKPFYVDFDSPILVNILAKYVRRTGEQGADDARLSVTEMLPDPFHTWLPDAQGRRYTSELRIIAIDLEAIKPGC